MRCYNDHNNWHRFGQIARPSVRPIIPNMIYAQRYDLSFHTKDVNDSLDFITFFKLIFKSVLKFTNFHLCLNFKGFILGPLSSSPRFSCILSCGTYCFSADNIQRICHYSNQAHVYPGLGLMGLQTKDNSFFSSPFLLFPSNASDFPSLSISISMRDLP